MVNINFKSLFMKNVIAIHNSNTMYEFIEVSKFGFIDKNSDRILVFDRENECIKLIVKAIFSNEWSVIIKDND